MQASQIRRTLAMQRAALWTRLFCVVAAYNLAGCAAVAPAPCILGGSYALAERQSAALGGAVSVRYDRFEDSRCPKNAMCVWAGKVSYHFTLSSPAGKESFALDYEGDRFVSATLPQARFGIAFAGVRGRSVDEHAVVLEVAVK